MKPLSILMSAAATSAFACAATALIGAAALAQETQEAEAYHHDDAMHAPSEDTIGSEHLMAVQDQDVMHTDDTYEPAPDETGRTSDLLRETEETWDEADMDRAPYTDDHHWVDLRVQSEDGAEIGDIERVRLSQDGEVEAIVVEYGGVLEVGGREVEIEREDVSFSPEGRTPTAVIGYSQAEFEAMPAFDESQATGYPLADDEFDNPVYDNNENEQGTSEDPADPGR